MASKIDRQFAERFPHRNWWLRPATAEERQIQFRGRAVEGWHACLAVGRCGEWFRTMPFYATSADVADIDDQDAGVTAAHVAETLQAGAMPYVQIRREGL